MDFKFSLGRPKTPNTLPFKVAGDGDLTVTLDVYNLTKEPVGSWVQYEGVPYQYWNPGTTYTLGLRGKF